MWALLFDPLAAGLSVLLLVILPRLVLSLFAGWRAARLARRFPIDLQQPYFRNLASHIGAFGVLAPDILGICSHRPHAPG